MRALFALPLLALVACATPQERCINKAAAPYRAALAERAEIAKTLARGFVYETEFERRRVFKRCKLPKGGFVGCWRTDSVPVTKRVPIDPAVLRQRDAQLARDLPRLERAAQRGAETCRATFQDAT